MRDLLPTFRLRYRPRRTTWAVRAFTYDDRPRNGIRERTTMTNSLLPDNQDGEPREIDNASIYAPLHYNVEACLNTLLMFVEDRWPEHYRDGALRSLRRSVWEWLAEIHKAPPPPAASSPSSLGSPPKDFMPHDDVLTADSPLHQSGLTSSQVQALVEEAYAKGAASTAPKPKGVDTSPDAIFFGVPSGSPPELKELPRDLCDLGCGVVHSTRCEAPIAGGGICGRAFHHGGAHEPCVDREGFYNEAEARWYAEHPTLGELEAANQHVHILRNQVASLEEERDRLRELASFRRVDVGEIQKLSAVSPESQSLLSGTELKRLIDTVEEHAVTGSSKQMRAARLALEEYVQRIEEALEMFRAEQKRYITELSRLRSTSITPEEAGLIINNIYEGSACEPDELRAIEKLRRISGKET